MIPILILCALTAKGHQATFSLDDLEKTAQTARKAQPMDFKTLVELNQSVFKVIEANQVTTPKDFNRASSLISDFRMQFEISRVKHELCLAALASGDLKARTDIKKTWDALLMSTGREQRIGTYKVADAPRFRISPAPKSIWNLISDPDKAVLAAKEAKTDEEVTQIWTDDQAVRKQDWSKLTPEQRTAINKSDRDRLARMTQLLNAGRVVTADDFSHASLVFQHGSTWEDYSIAHELAICSLLLGNLEWANLAAVTYDRMLLSAGYRQRFGTQYSNLGNIPLTIEPIDTTAINDAERKALNCPTLEEARKRKV